MLSEIDSNGHVYSPDTSTADGLDSKALFVVRNPVPGRQSQILYKLAWATYHAYNGTGYGSLYAEAMWHTGDPPGYKVTTRRPGGGTGGQVMLGDSPDAHAPFSRRQTFAHWDVPFIEWLEGTTNFSVDYCTDLDLHTDPNLLDSYFLLLSVGHDEYWSDPMRSAIERFVGHGGNVAFFSGNIAGWRIHFTNGDSAFVCAKTPPLALEAQAWQWDQWQSFNPENRITGVSFYDGGGWWDGRRDPVGYRLQHTRHWVFDGTGLRDGDVLGADLDPPLVGYEADGTEVCWHHGYAQPSGKHGTPEGFSILGIAELSEGWHARRPGATASMGILTSASGGIIFQGATTDWSLALRSSPQVERITINILRHLSLPSVRIIGPLPLHGGKQVAVEGELADFAVDLSGMNAADRDAVQFDWTTSVSSHDMSVLGSTVRVRAPSPVAPLTVAVSVHKNGAEIGFGTQTVMPLTREGALRLEVCVLLREMVMPGDPSQPLVSPTGDPLEIAREINTVNLYWIGERARRLIEVTGELIRLCEDFSELQTGGNKGG